MKWFLEVWTTADVIAVISAALLPWINCYCVRTDRPTKNTPNGAKKLRQAKFGHFSILSIRNWTIFFLNHLYNWLIAFDCTDLSRNYLKKERLCSNLLLGQTWFEFYCMYSNFITLYTLYWNEDWTHITTVISATIAYNMALFHFHCIFMPVEIGQPLSKWYLSYFLISVWK